MLTIAMQNYLETIYELATENMNAKSGVRSSDIASKLNVSKASVNNAISVLVENGFVTNERYQDVYLTEEGIQTAELLCRRHEIIKELFTRVLGIEGDIADEDACAIEHVISGRAIQKMSEYLKKTKGSE